MPDIKMLASTLKPDIKVIDGAWIGAWVYTNRFVQAIIQEMNEMTCQRWHYYAEIYMNNNRNNEVYKCKSGVVSTSVSTDDSRWYDELRNEICKDIGFNKPNNVLVMSLTKLQLSACADSTAK